MDSNDAPSLRDRLSPWATRVGGAFLGGFVIGWAFRAFLKTMALVTAAGVAILAVLSHFNVLNIDVERAQSGFQSTTSWVSQQAEHLKDRGMALFPGSMSGLAGMFVGFRRK